MRTEGENEDEERDDGETMARRWRDDGETMARRWRDDGENDNTMTRD